MGPLSRMALALAVWLVLLCPVRGAQAKVTPVVPAGFEGAVEYLCTELLAGGRRWRCVCAGSWSVGIPVPTWQRSGSLTSGRVRGKWKKARSHVVSHSGIGVLWTAPMQTAHGVVLILP